MVGFMQSKTHGSKTSRLEAITSRVASKTQNTKCELRLVTEPHEPP